MILQPNLPLRLWHDLIIYEFHPNSKMDKWFSDPNVHGILQNVIQMFTWHPQPLLAKRPKHHGRKIHATTS